MAVDLDAIGEQQAKSLFVAAIREQRLQETNDQMIAVQAEIGILEDELLEQKESKAKVFKYLRDKLEDSYEQIKMLEAKFDHERREATSRKAMHALQLRGLEHQQKTEREKEEKHHKELRDEVSLLERYQRELPGLEAEIEGLKEAHAAESLKAAEYKEVSAPTTGKVKL